jgi:hypothetical protein
MSEACPLVLIRWQDSRQPTSAWRFLSDVGEPSAVECATVGWLLKDNRDVKVVCQSVGDLDDPENAQASGVMTIPARCVISIERLEEIEPLSGPSSCQAPATEQMPPQTSQLSLTSGC